MKNYFTKRIQPYDISIFVARDVSLKDAQKKLKKRYGVKLDNDLSIKGRVAMLTSEDGDAVVFIYIQDHEDINAVSHESYHAASAILDYCGVQTTHENDEAMAYLVGHIAEVLTMRKVSTPCSQGLSLKGAFMHTTDPQSMGDDYDLLRL